MKDVSNTDPEPGGSRAPDSLGESLGFLSSKGFWIGVGLFALALIAGVVLLVGGDGVDRFTYDLF